MAVGDLAEVAVIYDDAARGDVLVTTFGFKALTSGATRAGLASAFKTALVKNTSGGLLSATSTLISSGRLTVRDILPGTGVEEELAYTAVAGTLASDMLPPQVAPLVSWRTSLAGRSFRGRTYMPPATEDAQVNGFASAGLQSGYALLVTNMLAVFGPAGSNPDWQFVVISRRHNGAPRVPPIGTPVTVGIVRPVLATQRRRNN
jgi:hypothetical protein